MNDQLIDIDSQEVDIGALLVVLCLIEAEHPGTIAHAVYVAALSKDGWRFSSQSSNPPRARKAQEDFMIWLDSHIDARNP